MILMKEMKTIVWDVDDVLNDLTKEWFEREWLVTNPKCKVEFTQLISNPPNALLNISTSDYLISLDRFRLMHGPELKPVIEILEWFKNNGARYRNIVLTATPLFYAPRSSEWVLRHFGPWIKSFNFVPSVRKESEAFSSIQNKASYMKLFERVDLFIDDNEKNVSEARALGIKSLLMPRPWNSNKSTLQEFIENLNTIDF